jgi:iron(III) transport system substrate-binding protein
LASDVAQGNTDFALINHYYYYRLKETVTNGVAGAQLAYFVPEDPGYLDAVSGAAVPASSKHSAAAQKFLNFLTSGIGQTILESG